MTSLRLRAAAKVNWTLEVLGKRDDGYHEVRTVLQTIGWEDSLTLEAGDELKLTVLGATRGLRSAPSNVRRAARALAQENLALRAAKLLQERADYKGGASIRLRKNIPVAAGLGGGSSDAAASLRGLRRLWQLDVSDTELTAIASQLGSDVPFFLRGGAALASSRGEVLMSLPDVQPQRLLVCWREGARETDKTARMYAALRPEHYSAGERTEALAARVGTGEPIRDEDLCNVFEAVLPEVDPEGAAAFQGAAALGLGRPHLCGSGPALFFLIPPDESDLHLILALQRARFNAVGTATLLGLEALAISEVV